MKAAFRYKSVALLVITCAWPNLAFSAQKFIFDAPRGGEVFIAGQTQQVQLRTFVRNVKVELSRDGGKTFEPLGVINDPLLGAISRNTVSWRVTGPASGMCLIRVSATSGKTEYFAQSGMFIIFESLGGANVIGGGATAEPAPGSVSTSALADGSVTTPKLADASVTTAKLADDSVSATKISSGAASANFVLLADGNGRADWQPAASGSAAPVANTSGNSIVTALNDPQTTRRTLEGSLLTGSAAVDISGNAATATVANSASSVTGTVGIANGGTGAKTKNAAFDNLAPTSVKGDLIVRSAAGNVALSTGGDGNVLVADSTTAEGVKWAASTPPGGAAGGDLTGNYPNPTLNAVSATTGNNIVSAIGQANAGTVPDARLSANVVKADALGNVAANRFLGPLTGDVTGNVTGNVSGTAANVTGVVLVAHGGTNSNTALNNDRVMVSSGGAIVEAPALANGQLLVGSTGGAPTATTLTAGGGIAVTNGAGSISIATTGAPPTGNAGGDLSGTYPNPTLNTASATTGNNIVSAIGQANAGTVPDARLSANVVKADALGNVAANRFLGPLTGDVTGNVTGNVSGTAANVTGVVLVAHGGTNSNTALNNDRVMVSSGGAIVEAPALANGQLLVGSTGGAPTATTLTAGGGIAVTNGAGSISIATTGAPPTGNAGGDLSGTYPNPTLNTASATTGNNIVSAIGQANAGTVPDARLSGNVVLNNQANTFTTGAQTVQTSGSALALTGAPAASATQSLVQVGNAIVGGNSSADGGTWLGLNAAAAGNPGSAADFVNFQNNGTSCFKLDYNGCVSTNLPATATASNFAYFGVNNGVAHGIAMENINSAGQLYSSYKIGSADFNTTFNYLAADSGRMDFQGDGGLIMSMLTSTKRIGIGTQAPVDPFSFGIAPTASGTSALVNLTNTALVGGNTGGTFIGANRAGFSPDFINYQVNGSTHFKVDSYGGVALHSITKDTSGGLQISGGGINVAAFSLAVSSSGALGGTSGLSQGLRVQTTFNPGSGTGQYAGVEDNSTINQVGGASGVARGIYINPTLTSAADYRCFESAAGRMVLGTTPALSATAPLVRLGTSDLAGGAANGTYIGANPAAAGADFANYQVNGTTKFKVDAAGAVTASAVQVAGPITTALSTQSANHTLAATDSVIRADATAGPLTMTLPDASTCGGRQYVLKKFDDTANAVTVATTSAQTIDGAANYTLGVRWQFVAVVSTGANWEIIGKN